MVKNLLRIFLIFILCSHYAFAEVKIKNMENLICSNKLSNKDYGIPPEILKNLNLAKLESIALHYVEKNLFPHKRTQYMHPGFDNLYLGEIHGDAKDDALAKVVNKFFDRMLENGKYFRKGLINGDYQEKILIGIHSYKDSQKNAFNYLKNANVLGEIPWVQLYGGNVYTNGIDEVISKAAAVRLSGGGEIRDMKLNSSEIHVFGGDFGSCLSDGIESIAEKALSYKIREALEIIVHTKASYASSQEVTLYDEILRENNPMGKVQNRLRKLFNDGFHGSREYELVRSEESVDDSTLFQLTFKRLSDNKNLIIKFVDSF